MSSRGGGNAWRAGPNKLFGDVTIEGDLIVNGTASFSGATAILPGFRIWQYQDFTAPVSGGLTLSAFENGTSSAPFTPGWIVPNTAVSVRQSNNDKAPTSTDSIPGRWLPSNRIKVTLHSSTAVTLNLTPAVTQAVRIFYLVQLPSNSDYPENYTEAPKFVTSQRLEELDTVYVNQAGDEDVYGTKSWKATQIITGSLIMVSGAVTGQVSDISNHTIGSLLNVSSSSDVAATGQYLGYNGTVWEPTGAVGGGSGETNTASNLGSGAIVFAQKVGADLQFKTLTTGSNIIISSSANEINISLSGALGLRTDYGSLPTDPVASPDEGDKYYNTTLNKEMRYDSVRGKWLSVESNTLLFGRSGNTAAGSYYRGIDSKTFSAFSGLPTLFSGTIVSMGYTRSDTDTSVFEVVRDGTQVSFLSSSAIYGVDNTINGDFSPDGVLSVRNQSGGSTTSGVQGWALIKWRI